jgi:GTP:adenosylcobinamide-phosphate guanylyltransferase
VKAVITAGGRIDGRFAEIAGTRVKALAQVRGTSMLERMILALRETGVDTIAVVGGDEVKAACAAHVERFIDESVSGGENLLRALRAWPSDGRPLLYATSDLPYVTADAIRNFAERVAPQTLAVSLSTFGQFSARFPGAPPFGITLAGERVVNGGVFSIPDESIDRLAGVATRFFAARKQPWRMAGFISPFVLLHFLLGRLSIGELERLAQRVLAVPSKAVRNTAPELAYDVDTEAEYRYACAHP